MVHGDDFITAGPAQDIDWFEREMAKHLEIVCKARLGFEPGCSKEGKILSRVVRVDQKSFTWEADPRHAELAIQELGLTTARPQLSPGGANAQDGDEELKLDTAAKSAYRTVTARLNYLASDRPELLLATKECGKAATCSSRADLTHLKRIGRFLLKEPRCVWHFPWQDETNVLEGSSDAGAGGCTRTRRSTSGGVLRLGGHTLCAWSSSQNVVALSSCESEYYSLVRCAGEAIGLRETLEEMQLAYNIRLWTDARAARGLALRTGGGQIKHMEARC